MTGAEARAKFKLDPEHGGIVIGMLDDGTLLRDPCRDGSPCWLVFSGSGGGKTSSITVPTLDPSVGWNGPVLVFDPAGEVAHMTRDMREAAGQRVVVIKPGRPGFNALDWIDINDPLAPVHAEAVVELIGKEKPKAETTPMWRASGKTLQEAIMLDMLWDPALPKAARTLAEFARRVSIPEDDMRYRLREICEKSASPMARVRAGQVMSAPDKTFGGYYVEAQTDVKWLLAEPYAQMVSGGSMRSDDLVRGDVTVYVEIPMTTLQSAPEVGRTVINALLQGVYRHQGRGARRILVILEDVNLLGHFKPLADARDNGRKYGLVIMPNWQSAGQISDTWGIGGKSQWQESARGEIHMNIRNEHAAEEISKRCGTYTGIARTEGRSRGRSGGASGAGNSSRNEGLSEVAVPLIRPDQVQQLEGRIVFYGRDPTLKCGNPAWYLQPGMRGRVKDSPFREPEPPPQPRRGRHLWAALTARLRA